MLFLHVLTVILWIQILHSTFVIHLLWRMSTGAHARADARDRMQCRERSKANPPPPPRPFVREHFSFQEKERNYGSRGCPNVFTLRNSLLKSETSPKTSASPCLVWRLFLKRFVTICLISAFYWLLINQIPAIRLV